MSNENDWNQYSKLVLKELETLGGSIRDLQKEIQDLKQELSELRSKESRVKEIFQWKARIDEVASPSQLKDLQEQVADLRSFKTKAVTVFTVVQFLMGVAIALIGKLF